MTRPDSYNFDNFTLDCSTRQLLRQGEPVHLSPKAYELLQLLVEAAPRALSKAQLQDRIWPDTFVVEANLQHLIAEVRRALGDSPRQPRYVRTLFGFGYAFQQPPAPADAAEQDAICRLGWDDGRVTLAAGEYTIGRDAAADVVLDSTTVSRQHARLRVSGAGVALEDLGSKNGTFVGDRRVHGVVTLSDGDGLRFGNVPVTIRIGGSAGATATVVHDSDTPREP
jgi:DNA-binding winged helix-turn-helix (wHTH) protein